MKVATLLIAGTLLLGCSRKISGDGTGQTIKVKTKKTMTASVNKAPAGLETTILGAKISGNTLLLDVSYIGGCGIHDFELIGNPSISKSLPPIRSVYLLHTLASTEEKCKAIVTTTLKFDIKQLAYTQEAGSEIYLTIDGWKDRLLYKLK